jgi:hypothetical protein
MKCAGNRGTIVDHRRPSWNDRGMVLWQSWNGLVIHNERDGKLEIIKLVVSVGDSSHIQRSGTIRVRLCDKMSTIFKTVRIDNR